MFYIIAYSVKIVFLQDSLCNFPYFGVFEFSSVQAFHLCFLLSFKISAHQRNKDKPRSTKCHHFCFAFDSHNYCPTCMESGKGDDPCVTFDAPCEICASFTEDQMIKITHRKR